MSATRKIEAGKVYSAKVAGTWLPVRIDKSLGHGRYEGVAMPSGKTVKVATAAIKGDGQSVEAWNAAHARAMAAADQENARLRDERQASPDGMTASERVMAAPKTKRKVAAKEKKDRKPGGLAAAVRVLREAGTPLNCGDMVKTALEKGYWQTGGKTPAATIYAAIITEISKKGDKSRFRKVDRGMFELTEAGKEAR